MNLQYNVGEIAYTNISLQIMVSTTGVAHSTVYLDDSIIQESDTQSGNIIQFVIGTSDKLKGQLLTIDTWVAFADQVPTAIVLNDMKILYAISGGLNDEQSFIAEADDITNSPNGYNSFIEKIINFV